MHKRQLERASSAITLSDMEVFVFPELMYSLVIANILSPRLWRWRDDPWFKDIHKQKPYRRLQRLKQYIMDHYVFNLDLETWGLTKQKKELARFAPFIAPEVIAESNALFGYTGDAYYFDIDIRTHFGLNAYDAEVIPYWKTETIEAMDAFQHREGFTTGAGECVSLAALYAAALFVVARIPLHDIFLMATPLHSQNFIDIDAGILINNRRLVTKPMWFNGTQISGQARRALENERVTIVAHATGWIHLLYPRATIEPAIYSHFSSRLRDFLTTPLTPEILGNFLRQNRTARACFVLRCLIRGAHRYITLEQAFQFEQDSPYQVTDSTRDRLIESIPQEIFAINYPPCKIVLNDVEDFVAQQSIDLGKESDVQALHAVIGDSCMNAEEMVRQLIKFCHTTPRLPHTEQVTFDATEGAFDITPAMTREEILAHIEFMRTRNPTADLAFYAWRDLSRTDIAPFLYAAMTRNPVSRVQARDREIAQLVVEFNAWTNESIYEESFRVAQPDEVWNFKRGDGFEKALLLGNILQDRYAALHLEYGAENTINLVADKTYIATFAMTKVIPGTAWDLTTYVLQG